MARRTTVKTGTAKADSLKTSTAHEARGICEQARLCTYARADTAGRGKRGRRVRGAEACRAPASLRFATRARRRAQELGRHPRPEPHTRRKAACGAHRGPSDRIL